MGKVHHPRNGEPLRVALRKDRTAVIITRCCDCGLTHVEQVKPTARYVVFRVWRDEKRTEQCRKRRKRLKDKPRRKA